MLYEVITHFFNTHLRPEKFPMDIVIFTGRMPLEEVEETLVTTSGPDPVAAAAKPIGKS